MAWISHYAFFKSMDTWIRCSPLSMQRWMNWKWAKLDENLSQFDSEKVHYDILK